MDPPLSGAVGCLRRGLRFAADVGRHNVIRFAARTYGDQLIWRSEKFLCAKWRQVRDEDGVAVSAHEVFLIAKRCRKRTAELKDGCIWHGPVNRAEFRCNASHLRYYVASERTPCRRTVAAEYILECLPLIAAVSLNLFWSARLVGRRMCDRCVSFGLEERDLK